MHCVGAVVFGAGDEAEASSPGVVGVVVDFIAIALVFEVVVVSI